MPKEQQIKHPDIFYHHFRVYNPRMELEATCFSVKAGTDGITIRAEHRPGKVTLYDVFRMDGIQGAQNRLVDIYMISREKSVRKISYSYSRISYYPIDLNEFQFDQAVALETIRLEGVNLLGVPRDVDTYPFELDRIPVKLESAE